MQSDGNMLTPNTLCSRLTRAGNGPCIISSACPMSYVISTWQSWWITVYLWYGHWSILPKSIYKIAGMHGSNLPMVATSIFALGVIDIPPVTTGCRSYVYAFNQIRSTTSVVYVIPSQTSSCRLQILQILRNHLGLFGGPMWSWTVWTHVVNKILLLLLLLLLLLSLQLLSLHCRSTWIFTRR